MILQDFNNGLIVTGWGMGLVFLTLFICMLVIKLLDRVFRPKPEPAAEVPAPSPAPVLVPVVTADEAAAVAVALALEQRKLQPAPEPVKPKEPAEEIVGGVMLVKPIEPAPWSGPSRKA